MQSNTGMRFYSVVGILREGYQKLVTAFLGQLKRKMMAARFSDPSRCGFSTDVEPTV